MNLIKNKSKLLPAISFLCFIILAYSCKKLDLEKVHENIKTVKTYEEARILLKETYDLMKGVKGIEKDGDSLKNFYPYLLLTTALYSDEATLNGSDPSWQQFENRDIKPDNPVSTNIWFLGYKIIDNASIILRDVENFEEDSYDQDNIIGQAKAIWAFTHFLLMNLYGNIPLSTQPLIPGDYPEMADKAALYEVIIEYLGYSIDYLSEYNISDNIIINKNVAKALLARVYLYNEQYDSAYQKASDIIQSVKYSLCTDYHKAFTNDENTEIIWKLDYNNSNKNMLGYNCYPADSGGIFKYTPSKPQLKAFDESDTRKTYCINSIDTTYFISKYRGQSSGDFDIPVIRYSEILLIAAESLLKLGNSLSALGYYNEIRERAGLEPLTASGDLTIDTLLQERMCEFAYEGQRWFDINRCGKADEIISQYDYDFGEKNELWPIPQKAINENPNLYQNPGY